MEHRKVKDQEDIELQAPLSESAPPLSGTNSSKKITWKLKTFVICALTVLTSSQAILIYWSKLPAGGSINPTLDEKHAKYKYSVSTSNFLVEALKCAMSVAALSRIWNSEGVSDDNKLSTTFDEVKLYPIPALLYMAKNLLQYYIFYHVEAPGYQILKNLNIISTGILYRIILKRKLSNIQWAAFLLLFLGCTNAQIQTNPSPEEEKSNIYGWAYAIIMALLSGLAGVYTEAIMKKRLSRNINVQNFWLYVFGMAFNFIWIIIHDLDEILERGFFHGYSLITVVMIMNQAFSGLAVSAVIKFGDNIVKVYSTSVAMFLTAFVSVYMFGFTLTPTFYIGTMVVSIAIYLHYTGKQQQPQK
ncbi:CMP-sialic acid transporter [Rhynchospora pubera]|uniref:CMP-sialic acid transporter n=1 Tax=Rhynchospora pubera TaxID=906938 RepID=A0AAV8FAJ9_9POAL|nr:CMP-sialic acid transporter [Rhynchospora pubera]